MENKGVKTFKRHEFIKFIETISGFKLNSNPEKFKKQELQRYRNLRKEVKILNKQIIKLKKQNNKTRFDINATLDYIKKEIKEGYKNYLDNEGIIGIQIIIPFDYKIYELFNWYGYLENLKKELSISFTFDIRYFSIQSSVSLAIKFESGF